MDMHPSALYTRFVHMTCVPWPWILRLLFSCLNVAYVWLVPFCTHSNNGEDRRQVRDIYTLPNDHLLLVATDRQSAFDR